jgi:RNA polymerase sigma-70 factor (ECF subfamily)
VEGLSYEEISERLNVPVGTIKSRVSRGREALRNALHGREKSWHGRENRDVRARAAAASRHRKGVAAPRAGIGRTAAPSDAHVAG